MTLPAISARPWLQAYREQHVGEAAQMLALGLSSRKNMCIHTKVADEVETGGHCSPCHRHSHTHFEHPFLEFIGIL